MDVKLPPEVRPIWIEGVFTSEYERDTLPLLFASDRLFDEYYDALALKYPHVSVALEQIRGRNVQARQQRADGLWQDCVESLGHCVHLRRCVFEETDFQFAAAQKHHILSMLNFATFFLKESKAQDAMLMRSFELFKAAEDAAKDVQHKTDRCFLLAAVHNNFASYFAKRKRFKAAAQRLSIGLRVWNILNLHAYDLYFAVQRGSGEAWSNRFDDSYRLLRQATAFAPKDKQDDGNAPPGGANEEGRQEVHEVDDDPDVAPVRYQIQMLNSGVSLMAASNIALHHNIAVALIGLRRYKEAAPWCSKAMELATAQSAFLKSGHPIVVAVRKAQDFCEKTSFVTKFSEFRMKQSEFVSDEYRRMQHVIHRSQGGQQPRAQSAQSAPRPKPPTQHQEEDDRRAKDVCSSARKHPNSAQAAHVYFPRAAPRVSKPSQAEALRTYLRRYSERQLVEEFGLEGRPKKKKVPKPPPKATESPPAEETHSAAVENQERTAQPEQPTSPAKEEDKLDAADKSGRHSRSPSDTSRRSYSSDSRYSRDSRDSYDSRDSRSPRSTPPDSRDPSPRKEERTPAKEEVKEKEPETETSPKKEDAPEPATTTEQDKPESTAEEESPQKPVEEQTSSEAKPVEEKEPASADVDHPSTTSAEDKPKEEDKAETEQGTPSKDEVKPTAEETTSPQPEEKANDSPKGASDEPSNADEPSPKEEDSGSSGDAATTHEESKKSEEQPSTPEKAEPVVPKPPAQPASYDEGDDDFEDDSPAATPRKEEEKPKTDEKQANEETKPQEQTPRTPTPPPTPPVDEQKDAASPAGSSPEKKADEPPIPTADESESKDAEDTAEIEAPPKAEEDAKNEGGQEEKPTPHNTTTTTDYGGDEFEDESPTNSPRTDKDEKKDEEAATTAHNQKVNDSTMSANNAYSDDTFEAESPAHPPVPPADTSAAPEPSAESPEKKSKPANMSTTQVNDSTASANNAYADDTFEAETPMKAGDASAVNVSKETDGYGDDQFEDDSD